MNLDFRSLTKGQRLELLDKLATYSFDIDKEDFYSLYSVLDMDIFYMFILLNGCSLICPTFKELVKCFNLVKYGSVTRPKEVKVKRAKVKREFITNKEEKFE